MAVQSNSIILQSPPADEELLPRVEDVVRSLKEKLDLFFVYEERIERAPDVIVHVWWEPMNPKLDIRLVCDDAMDTRYINVTSPDKEQRQHILDELVKHFDVVALEDLREAVRQHGDDVNAWIRLTLGIREEFDAESFELVRNGLKSPSVKQRYGAAQAAAMLQWSQLAEPVQDALLAETDPGTKEVLKVAAQVCISRN